MGTTNTIKKIPFVDLTAQYRSVKQEIHEALERVMETSAYILGPEVTEFEKEFAGYCEAEYALGVDSGTSALELILRGYDIGAGDEVITVANTFIATTYAITYTGAKPVLIDTHPVNYTIDVSKIEKAITPRTKAIMPVHLYGQPADMDSILAIAQKHGIIVIEDACQAHGARYKGKRVGSLGNAGAFSFYPAKNLGALGDGGMIVTNDKRLYEKIKMMRDYGQSQKYHHDELGYNRRLDSLQAAVLRVKLRYLDQWNAARRKHAALYHELLANTDVVVPFTEPYAEPIWHLYVIRCKNRDNVKDELAKMGVYCGIHYPIPIHLQKAYQYLGYRKGDFEITERYADQILSLPMYAELTAEMVAYVVESIKMVVKN